jgi:hypothetical protein
MKKIAYFIIAAFAVSFVASSCVKDQVITVAEFGGGGDGDTGSIG